MRFVILILLAFLFNSAFGGVDTINVYSIPMKKNLRCVVITPKNYKKAKLRFPVVYLLHGYGGDHANWIKRVPAIDSLANMYQMIIVCPDGGTAGWYFDSPVDSTSQYESFVAALPDHIDQRYRTIPGRKARAITGLSMGGHGALFLALRHPETFGACGSMSGVLDINRVKKSYELPRRLGDTLSRFYEDWSVINLVEKYQLKDSLAIMIDCGVSDAFYSANKATHEKMLKLKIPHDYIERAGGHNWDYWRNAVKFQLLFFREWFNRNR
jgi:S-formylglutathione hydrolase FrmB